MKVKKLISSALALSLAFGVFSFAPASDDFGIDTAISASAVTTSDGFVLETDSDGEVYVAGYTGTGGSITIPKKAAYIENKVFENDRSITNITVPKGALKYGIFQRTFFNCSSLKSLTIEGDVLVIGGEAFAYCTNLEKVIFKGSVGVDADSGIGEEAFAYCHALKSVQFTDSSAYLGKIFDSAFYGCYSLKTVKLPSNVNSIGEYVFANCPDLTSITIPENTKITGKRTFGYVLGYISEDDWRANEGFGYLKADGKTAVYNTKYYVEPPIGWYRTYTNPDIYGWAFRFLQRPITLNVVKGSAAEQWAKKNDIKYTIVKAEKSDSNVPKLAAPEKVKATKKTSNSITLSWSKVDGADAYIIYRYNTSSKKYVKVKTVSGTKYTVTGLKSGTKYQFKVAAAKKSGKGYKAGATSKPIAASTK